MIIKEAHYYADSEKMNKMYDRSEEIYKLFSKNKIWAEPYNHHADKTYYEVSFEIDGDWKHDHLFADMLVKENFSDLIRTDSYELGDSQSDDYDAVHTYTFRY